MLRQLVDDLRYKPPGGRSASDMDRVLQQASGRWYGGLRLLSRREAYTRTCAYRDDGFEVLLLNWAAGAVSAVHDHGDQDCWMLVLSGHLRVDDFARVDSGDVRGYARIEARGSRILEAGGLDIRAGRFDLHRVAAEGPAPSISLHVYAAPLREYLIYDESSRRCEMAFGTYDDVISPYSRQR